VVWEKRVMEKASGGGEMAAEMEYRGDYLGRMEWIQYPDGERVRYGYNYGGEVERVSGEKEGRSFTCVERVGYDEYGQRVYMRLGNGVEMRIGSFYWWPCRYV
jgi:hypothetical protein